MQALEVIVGRPLEGKTGQLVFKYICNFHSETCIDYAYVKSRSLINPVWISLGDISTVNPIKDYMDTVLSTIDDPDDSTKEFLDATHKVHLGVSNIDMLKSIMMESLKEKDCIFFIDDIHELHLTPNMLLELMNDYPNEELKNSFDIICTIRKG